MTEPHSAWKPLIDEWLVREQRLSPSTPVRAESVRVRDAVEIDDNVFVLVSFDIDVPWPVEEETPGDASTANTAVLQALRVRQPWIEKDVTRALAQYSNAERSVTVYEHPLGPRRAFSGRVEQGVDSVELEFDDDLPTSQASVVDGWFLTVVPEQRRATAIAGVLGGERVFHHTLVQDTVSGELIEGSAFTRTAGRTFYFSPPRPAAPSIPFCAGSAVDP